MAYSSAAYSAQVDNVGNNWKTGKVELSITDPSPAVPLFSAFTAAKGKPGLPVTLSIENDNEERRTLEQAANADGTFVFADIALDLGGNWFTLWQTDATGNESRQAYPYVIVGNRP